MVRRHAGVARGGPARARRPARPRRGLRARRRRRHGRGPSAHASGRRPPTRGSSPGGGRRPGRSPPSAPASWSARRTRSPAFFRALDRARDSAVFGWRSSVVTGGVQDSAGRCSSMRATRPPCARSATVARALVIVARTFAWLRHDAGVAHQPGDVGARRTPRWLGVEPVEGGAERRALEQDGAPRETGLERLQGQPLEMGRLALDRAPPLLVVVGAHHGVALTPRAARQPVRPDHWSHGPDPGSDGARRQPAAPRRRSAAGLEPGVGQRGGGDRAAGGRRRRSRSGRRRTREVSWIVPLLSVIWAIQSARAATISSWSRPTKFHHITISSPNGRPPITGGGTGRRRRSPAPHPARRRRAGAGVTSTPLTRTEPKSTRTPYSKPGLGVGRQRRAAVEDHLGADQRAEGLDR